MEKFVLNANKREQTGKKVEQLRRQGMLPGILYGKDVKSEPISVDKKEFRKIFKLTGENTLVDLMLGSETKKVLITDHQIDALTSEPIHVDFHQVKLTEKVHAEVPLIFIKEEEAPVIRELEGTLIKEKDTLEVESFPQDIPHEIEVDVSVLNTFDDMIHVSDLKVAANVKILDEPEEVVAKAIPPRSEAEMEALEQEVVEDVGKVEEVEKEKEEEAVE